MQKHLLEEEHLMFQEMVQDFIKKEVSPYHEQWEKDGLVSKEVWLKAGAQGMLCMDFPEKYGGLGIKDFRYNAIVTEEFSKAGASGVGFFLHNDITAPYCSEYFNDAQKEKYMSKIASGEMITAIAMTEPGAGSDLAGIKATAVKKEDHYLLNGAKTFITNGIMSDLVIVAAKTDPSSSNHKGISLLLVEEGMPGFTRGKNLDKIGMKAQDTAEMFFEDVQVPLKNLLGEEGRGFYHLMNNLPQERLSLAASAIGAIEGALEHTIQYCKDRKAFGKSIGSFQNSRFMLAEMHTEATILRSFIDECILELNAGKLTNEKAAMVKYWGSDVQCKIMDQCLQLHGGYGYMTEYPIARYYVDSRVQKIYGGTNEIMKEIIGRSLGF